MPVSPWTVIEVSPVLPVQERRKPMAGPSTISKTYHSSASWFELLRLGSEV